MPDLMNPSTNPASPNFDANAWHAELVAEGYHVAGWLKLTSAFYLVCDNSDAEDLLLELRAAIPLKLETHVMLSKLAEALQIPEDATEHRR